MAPARKPRKLYRLTEVTAVCEVDESFVLELEREEIIRTVVRRNETLYPADQLERVRVAHELAGMGVNLAGAEVALHLRDQMIGLCREIERLLAARR